MKVENTQRSISVTNSDIIEEYIFFSLIANLILQISVCTETQTWTAQFVKLWCIKNIILL